MDLRKVRYPKSTQTLSTTALGRISDLVWGREPTVSSWAQRSEKLLSVLDPDALVHMFTACLNSVLFFMDQHHQGITTCVIHEFDFDRQDNKSYQPSFVIE